MGERTAIAWTDHTFNPWWGCTKVSAECTLCYAEVFDRRYGGAHWGATAPRRFFGDKHWNEPRKWNEAARRRGGRDRVFCGSMCDVFEQGPGQDRERVRLWALIRETPHLDWLFLTKRPENIARHLPALWGEGWPNVWLGVSVGHPDSVGRLDVLRSVPAVVRFVSAEPLIAPWLANLRGFSWVIAGGESGPKARPMDVEWARGLLDLCRRGPGIAFFMKQLGGVRDKRELLTDFPEDLRVREWPRVEGR